MADVTLEIGGRRHTIACRDGEQEQFRRLATMLDAYWPTAHRASGGLNAERTMLFVALMLADALEEADRRPAPEATAGAATTPDDGRLDGIAARLEALADALEADRDRA